MRSAGERSPRMSALFASAVGGSRMPGELAPMSAGDVEAVMAVEAGVYPFPWTRGNFIDSLAAGYIAQLARDGRGGPLLGYYVALAGVDEMHLLNITVAPAYQRQGHARFMLKDLVARSRCVRARRIWLEVRASNVVALAIYRHFGFQEQGLRTGYYPAAHGRRESAVVMSLDVEPIAGEDDALD
jgi:ribosomal-protein-alanine N-acetyltransferase